jgi:hypothetical protein
VLCFYDKFQAGGKRYMATLVLHHPEEQVRANNKKSFSSCINSGLGEGFGIPAKYIPSLVKGIKVVVLCNTKLHERRAEGLLDSIVHSGYTDTGMKRYDISILDLKKVAYHRRDFGRLLQTGVAIF